MTNIIGKFIKTQSRVFMNVVFVYYVATTIQTSSLPSKASHHHSSQATLTTKNKPPPPKSNHHHSPLPMTPQWPKIIIEWPLMPQINTLRPLKSPKFTELTQPLTITHQFLPPVHQYKPKQTIQNCKTTKFLALLFTTIHSHFPLLAYIWSFKHFCILYPPSSDDLTITLTIYPFTSKLTTNCLSNSNFETKFKVMIWKKAFPPRMDATRCTGA